MNNPFSEREKDVVQLLLLGKGNKQIALDLGISRRTVEFHLRNIYTKLGVNTRSEAILKLTELHLRESTGETLVNSTVDNTGDSTENGIQPIFRRLPVKKLYPIVGGLIAILLIAALIVMEPSPQNAEPGQTRPLELTPIANILGLSASATHTPIPASTETPPAPTEATPPTQGVIPSHTVNGYTATIESYYVDISQIMFQVRITGGDISFGDPRYFARISSPDLYDENGNTINTSGGGGPAVDPSLYQFVLVPTTLLTGDRIKGQFAFDLVDPPDYNKKLAQFRFDFELPIHPETRFYPKQRVTANGIEMLLDSVTVSPAFTQIYLCFPPPSFAPWMIGSQTTLRTGNDEVRMFHSSELFSSFTGNFWGIRSEPYWMPPTKDGSCYKVIFQRGASIPTAFTLTIPELEKLEPDMPFDQLLLNYPGLSPRDAYATYLEEHGNTHKGPWTFDVELEP